METRKHSSRMRTAHLLTASHSIPGPMYGGEVNAHLPEIPTPWTYPSPLDVPTPKGHGARDKWERTWDQSLAEIPTLQKEWTKNTHPYPLVNRQTSVKTLPSCKFVGGR